MKLSVVIPTLNESGNLPLTIRHTRRAARDSISVIVSDCQSTDDTTEIALCPGMADRVVSGAMCRADALNRGAQMSDADVLVFLHADTLLPDRFDALIIAALKDARVAFGAFDFTFGPRPVGRPFDNACLDWIELFNRIRFRWTGNFYGDQCIFVRRDLFDRAGGIPRVEMLEDAGLSRRMRRLGRSVILRPPVQTSPRRFLARGVVTQFAEDFMILTLDSIGIGPAFIQARYHRLNRDAH